MYLWIIHPLFLLFLLEVSARIAPFAERNSVVMPDSVFCLPSCRRLLAVKNTPDVACSCTPSCLIYGDCCSDAPFQNTGNERKDLGCLTLSGLGPVSVVNTCPRASGVVLEACTKGMGVTVPVTSKVTGITYSNYYCAFCNRDNLNLVNWPVGFRCCSGNSKGEAQTAAGNVVYDYNSDILWTASELQNGSRMFCECTFRALNDDLSFAMTLELRQCQRTEMSSCLSSWDVDVTRNLCSAYLDPVYSGDQVFRNRHCAICNFRNDETLTCSSDIYDQSLMSPARLAAFCKQRQIPNCGNLDRSKGRPVSISRLFTIRKKESIPSKTKVCDEGKRLDRRSRQCKDIPKKVKFYWG